MRRQLAKRDDMITKLRRENDELRDLRPLIEEFEVTNTNLKTENRRVKEEYGGLRAEIAAERDNCADLKGEIKRLKRETGLVSRENTKLWNKVERLRKDAEFDDEEARRNAAEAAEREEEVKEMANGQRATLAAVDEKLLEATKVVKSALWRISE